MTPRKRRLPKTSDGAGVDAETTGALDGHGLAALEASELEARVDLGERAVDAGRHGVGDRGGQLEDRVIRPEVEVVAVAALEVRPHVARDRPVGLARRARLELAAQARLAAAARGEVAVDHPIALAQRLARSIGRDARPGR